jgi:hypothetical protein
MSTETRAQDYNRAVIAGAVLLVPALILWILLLLYWALGIARPLMRMLADFETSPAGSVVMAVITIGCPFFALPLTVIGRWLAKVKGQMGARLATAVIATAAGLLVLGLALPLLLQKGDTQLFPP